MTARLAFDRVACLRGDRLLFEGLSFAIPAGGAAIVVGPNGVGKSSMLRIAAGLLPAAAGTVTREGGIAYLSEQASLDPQLPLGRALAFWADIDGASDTDVAAAMDALAISSLAEVPVRMLSTGQRRRAGLARVMLGKAAIWLLDEPGNGLDAATLGLLGTAIAAHRAQGGIVLAATHQPLAMDDAQEIAL